MSGKRKHVLKVYKDIALLTLLFSCKLNLFAYIAKYE